MAIKIERGGGAGPAAGQIIGQGLQAQAGIQQRDRQLLASMLSDIANRQRGAVGGRGGGGGGRGGGGGSSAAQLAAFQAEVAKREKEQKFSNDMALKREDARLDVSQWEYEYSTKQRHEMAQLERADQLVEQSEDLSLEEKATYRKMSLLRKQGFNPTLKPVNADKPKFSKERPAGTVYETESGETMLMQLNGEPKMLSRRDQNPRSLAARDKLKADATIEAANVARTQAIEDAASEQDFEREQSIRKYVQEQEIEYQDPIVPYDKEGKMNMTTRPKSPIEIEAEMRTLGYGGPPVQQQQPEQQQQAVVIETREQRDSLPPNTLYIGPDGVTRRTGGLLPQQPIPLGGR